MIEVEVRAESSWPFLIEIVLDGAIVGYLDRGDATYLAHSLLTAVEKSETLDRMDQELQD